MIRLLDILFSMLGIVISSPLLIILTLLGFFKFGSPLFKQDRVGLALRPFTLYKFRSMNPNVMSMPTHLLTNVDICLYGRFIRWSKLDELPQLFNVLMGNMSLVGPRPCLLSQKELIHERLHLGIYNFKPGITGLAQIRKIDMSTPQLLALTDNLMINELSLSSYFKYIILTIFGAGCDDPSTRS